MTRTYFRFVACFASLMGAGAAIYLSTTSARPDLPSVFVGAMLGVCVFSALCGWAS